MARHGAGHSYQLAVVVDDDAMGVNQVIRGVDLVPSTPRQILLFRQLGRPVPTFGHVPLAVDAAGRRLAKRDGSLKLSTLREAGVDPRRLAGSLIHSCGWSESVVPMTPREAIERCEPARMPAEPWVVTSDALERLQKIACRSARAHAVSSCRTGPLISMRSNACSSALGYPTIVPKQNDVLFESDRNESLQVTVSGWFCTVHSVFIRGPRGTRALVAGAGGNGLTSGIDRRVEARLSLRLHQPSVDRPPLRLLTRCASEGLYERRAPFSKSRPFGHPVLDQSRPCGHISLFVS